MGFKLGKEINEGTRKNEEAKNKGARKRNKRKAGGKLLLNFQTGENVMVTVTIGNALVLCLDNYQPLYSLVLH